MNKREGNGRYPLVSIIIPTYNRAHTLARAIKSVLNQTYENFEIIVVDDGSSDDTEDVVSTFAERRLLYTKHSFNKGAAAARNTGIRVARGEYIAFQDSDDEWFPEKLEKQMEIFKNSPPQVGVVYTGFWRAWNDKTIYFPSSYIKKKEGNIHEGILEENFVTTQSAVVAAECFKKSDVFDENLPSLEDWELWIRISKYYEFRFVKEPLLQAYIQKDSINTNLPASIKARTLILEKHYPDLEKRGGRILSVHYYVLGCSLCEMGTLGQGRAYIVKAIKRYPYTARYYLAAAIALCGHKAFTRLLNIRRLVEQ
jgi:glycosyltransferase involved in cell wall biosynthesis